MYQLAARKPKSKNDHLLPDEYRQYGEVNRAWFNSEFKNFKATPDDEINYTSMAGGCYSFNTDRLCAILAGYCDPTKPTTYLVERAPEYARFRLDIEDKDAKHKRITFEAVTQLVMIVQEVFDQLFDDVPRIYSRPEGDEFLMQPVPMEMMSADVCVARNNMFFNKVHVIFPTLVVKRDLYLYILKEIKSKWSCGDAIDMEACDSMRMIYQLKYDAKVFETWRNKIYGDSILPATATLAEREEAFPEGYDTITRPLSKKSKHSKQAHSADKVLYFGDSSKMSSHPCVKVHDIKHYCSCGNCPCIKCLYMKEEFDFDAGASFEGVDTWRPNSRFWAKTKGYYVPEFCPTIPEAKKFRWLGTKEDRETRKQVPTTPPLLTPELFRIFSIIPEYDQQPLTLKKNSFMHHLLKSKDKLAEHVAELRTPSLESVDDEKLRLIFDKIIPKWAFDNQYTWSTIGQFIKAWFPEEGWTMFDKLSKSSKKYNEEENREIWNSWTSYMDDDVLEDEFEKVCKIAMRNVKQWRKHFNLQSTAMPIVKAFYTVEADTTIESPFVELDVVKGALSANKVVLMQADLGQGKTHCSYEISKSYPSVVWISARRTFSQSLKSKYSDLALYSESKGKINSERIIVQWESLHRLDEGCYTGCLLVCDEFTSTLVQAESPFNQNPSNNWRTFQSLCRGAKNVLLSDAFITQREAFIASQLDGSMDQAHFLRFIKSDKQLRPSFKCNSEAELIQAVDVSEGSGLKQYFYTSSFNRAENTYLPKLGLEPKKQKEAVKNKEPLHWAWYCSESGLKIGDPNLDWADKTLVMTMNTITVGVDCQLPFDTIFASLRNVGGGLLRDAFQSLYRVRHLKGNALFYVNPTPSNLLKMGPTDIYSMCNQYCKSGAFYDPIAKKEYGKKIDYSVSDIMVQNHLFNAIEANINNMHYAETFEYLSQMAGYDVKESQPMEMDLPELPKIKKDIPEYESVVNITMDEYQQMNEDDAWRADHKFEIQKLFLRSTLQVPVEDKATRQEMWTAWLKGEVRSPYNNLSRLRSTMNENGQRINSGTFALLEKKEKTFMCLKTVLDQSKFDIHHSGIVPAKKSTGTPSLIQ